MTEVFIGGVLGKMGRQVTAMMAETPDLTVVGGLVPAA